MMKENNSMLVHFQKLCKTLSWNSPNFALCRRTTWFWWALQASISQKVSCFLESENMDALISMCCSALQHWYFDFYVLFCLAALIFRHRQNFSPRGFVFLDRLNTLDRRPIHVEIRVALACDGLLPIGIFLITSECFLVYIDLFTQKERRPNTLRVLAP